MRRYIVRFALVAAAVAVGLGDLGCKSSSGEKKDEPLTDSGSAVPGFFHEIPADTYYVYTGLEAMPKSMMEESFEEYRETFSTTVSTILDAAKSSPRAEKSVVIPLLEELEGKFNPEGWKELGFSMEPLFAVYSVGGIPVFRMNLGDPKAFQSTLNRIESDADVDVTKKESDGQSYRVYESSNLRIPLVVRDGAVVGSVFDHELSDVILPYVLGQKEPDESLADTTALRDLADKYDYEKYMLGYIDLRGLVRTFAGVDEPDATTKAVMKAGELLEEQPSETCRTEYAEMADIAPRLVFGSTEFTADTVRTEFGLELQETYAEELAATVGPVPGLNTNLFERSILAIGMGIDLGKLTEMSRKHARNIVEDPYECEELTSLNRSARRMANRPIPTVVSQMRGVGLMLDKLKFSGGMMPSEVHAVALVRMQNPKSLIGRLQPLVPGMAQVEIEDDGVPVGLEQLGKTVPVLQAPYVAQKGKTLGFSAGVGMQDELAALLEKPTPESTRTAMAFSYNLDKLYASIPKSVKRRFREFTEGSELSSFFQGAVETRMFFREEGVFVRTRQKRGDGGQQNGNGSTGAASQSAARN